MTGDADARRDEGLDAIVATLRDVSERLADRALEVLKEAHRAGATTRPEAERTLTTARRAVEKAIALLGREA
ncbi:MAG: hypothetical protein ACO26C_00225 [Ilumatobacteraceae bacterium]|jgi:hypothetical protein